MPRCLRLPRTFTLVLALATPLPTAASSPADAAAAPAEAAAAPAEAAAAPADGAAKAPAAPRLYVAGDLGFAGMWGSSSEYTPETNGTLVQLDGTLSHQVTTWLGLTLHLQGALGSLEDEAWGLGRVIVGFELGRSATGGSFTFGLGMGLVWLGDLSGRLHGDGVTLETTLLVHGAASPTATPFGGLRLTAEGIHFDTDDPLYASGGGGGISVALVFGFELGVTP